MWEEKSVIPYKVQKGNRPKIEDIISCCLDDNLQYVDQHRPGDPQLSLRNDDQCKIVET